MNDNRRQFYRIEKWLALEFRELKDNDENLSKIQPEVFRASPYFLLQIQLQDINKNLDKAMEEKPKEGSAMFNLMRLINQKIDTIAKALIESDEPEINLFTDTVNLSEGGLSFLHNNPIALGQKMFIRLVVPNTMTGLKLLAEVKRCEPKESFYDIGLAFLRMPEACRSELARLILKSQMVQRHREDLKTPETETESESEPPSSAQ